MDIWKAGDLHLSLHKAQSAFELGEAAPAEPSLTHLASALERARARARSSEAWSTGAMAASSAACLGMLAAAVFGGCAVAEARLCAAALEGFTAAGVALTALSWAARAFGDREEDKASSLERAIMAADSGQCPRKALEARLGSRLAAKVGGWAPDPSEGSPARAKPRLGR